MDSTPTECNSLPESAVNYKVFNLVSGLNSANVDDCEQHIKELLRQKGHTVFICYLRSLLIVNCLLSDPKARHLVGSADADVVSSTIQGTLASTQDSVSTASVLLQALGDWTETKDTVGSGCLTSHLNQHCLEQALAFIDSDYWASLAVILALAIKKDRGLSSQAQSLLPSYLSRFPEERARLRTKSQQQQIIPFVISSLAAIGSPSSTGHTPETPLAPPTMGLAEQLISAGPQASAADVIAGFARQRQQDRPTQQTGAAGDQPADGLFSVDDVARALALIASNANSGSRWSASEFANGICEYCPALSWDDVIYRLPYSGLNVHDESGAVFIANVYLSATAGQNRAFPYSFMYEIWPDAQAQVSFLHFALCSTTLVQLLHDKHMPTLTQDPLDTLYRVYRDEFARMLSSPWNSLSLILALSHLLDSSAGEDARVLLDHGISQEPVLVTLALARLKVQHPRLQALLQQNVVRFLKRELKNSSLFFELFRICEKKVMLAFFCNLQRKDPSFARPILDTLVDLGIINELLLTPKREDIMMLDFVVELAVFASRRGYISFDTWFPSLLAEMGSDMLHASLEILHCKIQLEAARQRGEDGGVMAYSSGELTAMFKALGGVSMSPNNTANLKALYIQFTELAGELDRTENEHAADDSRIEKDAESLFLRLYRGELSLDKMVDILEDLQDSLRVHMRRTYAHVVQYPLEEFAFFANYPDKELTITGQLVGELVQRHMLPPSSEPTILDMLVRALQSPPASKTFLFGMTAVQAFQARIEQLPVFCTAIYQIAAVRQCSTSPVPQLLHAIISSAIPQTGSADSDGMAGPRSSGAARADGSSRLVSSAEEGGAAGSPAGAVFRCIKPSPLPVIDGPYSEPSEEAKDRIQFAVNNLAPNNLAEKTSEVDKALQPGHFVWFSQEVIVKRASQEPNYHTLYLQFVDALERPLLIKCILRETLVSIALLLNAESTISSSRDRGYLKNLGAWLGGITLARNQPILRENVSFKDLLCEGYDGGRLIVAIPFVCKVLEQAARSTIFHPPNPWLMGIMSVLSELYVTANLKLNLTFEIEVLCKALNLDVKEIAPSALLGSKMRNAVNALSLELSQASIGGGGGGGSSSGGGALEPMGGSGPATAASMHQMPVLSGNDISVDILGVLSQHASFQAAESLFTQQPTMKKVFYMLTERMIREIIPIHVARSIYVAVSCTRDTIQKDFCGEPNEEHVHRAAQVMARGLAGALAVSLCREQLKSKLYLTMREFLVGHSVPESSANSIAVGLVADNLDLACAIAEKESIERASVQIDAILSDSYVARKRTRERTGQPFYDIARYSRLAYPADFPDVLKVRLNGLQPGHLRVYEDFTQIPHFFSQIGSSAQGLPATAVASALMQSGGESAAIAGDIADSPADSTKKFSPRQCFEKFAAIIADLDKLVSTAAPSVSLSQLPSQHEACLYARDIIILAVRSMSPEDTAMDFAQTLVNYLFRAETRLGIDLYVLLLARVCEMSARVAKEVTNWLAFADDDRKHNVPVTIALINEGLISIGDEDDQLARLIESSRPAAVDFAARLVRKAVINRAVPASIQSFPKIVQAFVKLAQSGRAPPVVAQLLEDIQALQQSGRPSKSPQDTHPASAAEPPLLQQSTSASSDQPGALRRSQETASYQQILFNWARVYDHPAAGEPELATLVRQLQQQVPLHDANVAAAFFRACVEAAADFYGQSVVSAQAAARGGSAAPGVGYQVADALVKLAVYLTKLGPDEGDTSLADLRTLRMFLSSVALTVVYTHSVRQELFAAQQKLYFRLFSSVLYELNAARSAEEAWCTDKCLHDAIALFGETLLTLSPAFVPGFSFSWLMLASHRHFFPRLMESKESWPMASSIIETQTTFLEPFIISGQLTDSLKLLYRGMVCVILVVLHDFPEFLADYALKLCNSIPANCVQLRNLLLSAYPRDMRLPEPLTPNLKIDLLPDVSRSPSVPFDYATVLGESGLKECLEQLLTAQKPATNARSVASKLFKTKAPQSPVLPGLNEHGGRYNVALINAFALHAVVVITDISSSSARESAQRASLEMFKAILSEADPEERYLMVNAIANQLRFPSSHTYLCSRIILALFAKSDERVRECIARVLIERILVNRPFPWGLLVTLIELLRNPYYGFWSHEFTRRSPQIVEILSAVAKSIHPLDSRAQPGSAQKHDSEFSAPAQPQT
ncbi:Not1-domain-containing protein [Martensiomyces pterosporus]|nr:Not1-domain-containing protein [Martensiomyces pterosporus]